MNTKYLRFILGAAVLLSGILSAQAQPMPGGVTTNYTWAAWLTPDSYNNGTWTNLISSAGTIGNFTAPQTAPDKVNTGYNFHPAVRFISNGDNAVNRLISANNHIIANNDNITVILVMQRGSHRDTYDYLLSFNNSGVLNRQLWFTNGTSNRLRLEWPTTGDRDFTFEKGMFVLDNSNNNTSDGIASYVDGVKSTQASGAAGNNGTSNKLIIGSGQTGSYYGFEGTIQELIVLKANGTGNHLNADDLQKIHSYLAVKYGITLKGSNNYVNSEGVVVWNKAADGALYNNNIFGIARDDNSSLYQRQSHSANTDLITAYLGNTRTTLNSQNTGTIANDKTYLMFGSEGGTPVKQLTGVSRNETYENGSISMSDDPNIQSPVYRTQLTGAASMTVNLRVGMSDYSYVLVSKSSAFYPGAGAGTRIYPISNYIAQQVEVDPGHEYIKFIGFSPGPGGITTGLRLWLKASEESSLVVEDRPASDATTSGNNLYQYSLPANYTGTISAVSAWSDLVRGHTYSYAAGSSSANHRIPVLEKNSPEMNYYPAVRFWSSANNNGAYLSNSVGITSVDRPAGHTAYFMVNNNFNTGSWIYNLMFGDVAPGNWDGPGYGVEKSSSADMGVGRFRTSGTDHTGSLQLFKAGATSILGYSASVTGSSGNPGKFRFNAKDESFTFTRGSFDMTAPSCLGSGGINIARTIQGVMSEAIIFEKNLTQDETKVLESYMALKYGVTLTPSNTTTGRFTYTFSDGSVIWSGDVPSGNKFADFYHNISAVIRDDAARLNNSHSHSTDVGSILHMGVAGTRLSADGSEAGNLENDREAVVSGNDGATGNTHISDPDACGDFTDRFNRKWLIHKETLNDRPVTLLIGAQDNAGLTFGKDVTIANDYYNKLGSGYDVCLIVGASPADIEAGVYKAVVPMPHINGEHQCSYTFTEDDTYITFGWKPNNKGCVGDEDAQFTGPKTFSWTQWTTSTNTSTATGLTLPATPFPSVDLGDNIHVVRTQVAYPSSVRANRRYPRSVNTPVKGSLEVQRRGGTVNQDVIITVEFDHPVIPEFSISDLDSYLSSYEEVEISGQCSGSTYLPVLSYASSPNTARYKINGNIATVTKRGGVAASNKNGMLNVEFQGGVTTITIKYRIKNKAYLGTQRIHISPITLRPVPPPPPINEDGLSFVKQVKELDITTCDPVEYSFYIQNTNCDPKPVNFADILPEKMKWEAGSFGLDAVSSGINQSFDPLIVAAAAGSGEKLQIDNLYVPGAATLILTATAVLDEDAPGGHYENRASITYNRTVNDIPVPQPPFYSRDRETLEPYTSFDATWQQRQDTVVMVPTYDCTSYNAGSEIEVTYTLTNTNADITDMYLNVDFNEEFTLIGAVTATQSGSAGAPVLVTSDPVPSFSLAGAADGSTGFVFSTGVMVIKFKLKAPALSGIVNEVDDNDQPTGKKVDLDIAYDFSSGMDDPCMQTAIRGLQGNRLIPYSMITHIITNKNVTTGISK